MNIYIGLIFFALVVGMIIYGFIFNKAAIVKRKLRKTQEKSISTFQNNEVAKVVGEIKYVEQPLIAPLSGRKCAYYYVHVEEYRSNGKSSSWHTIIEEEISGNVVLKEGNSYALIETGLVKSYLITDAKYSSGFRNDATQVLDNYLKKHGYKSTSFLGMNKSIRYKEGILEQGEKVAVVGKGTWKKKSEINLDIPAQSVLVIGAHENRPVYFTDDPEVSAQP